jgi:hypothetical protein
MDSTGALPDLEHATAPLVPSSGTATLAVFLRAEPTGHRPAAGDVHTECAAIVAWRITRQGAEPIYAGPEPTGLMLLGVAGGKLLEVTTGWLHNDIDKATAAVLQEAQSAWDRDHPGEIVEIEPTPKAVAGGRRGTR